MQSTDLIIDKCKKIYCDEFLFFADKTIADFLSWCIQKVVFISLFIRGCPFPWQTIGFNIYFY